MRYFIILLLSLTLFGDFGCNTDDKRSKLSASDSLQTALIQKTIIDSMMMDAKNGDPIAQNNLGVCYFNGTGTNKDFLVSAKWYLKAAEQGIAQAQYNIGYCYEFGLGVPQNFQKAVFWYQLAAEQNHADAQNNLGNCHSLGKGVKPKLFNAYFWWLIAAANGSDIARHSSDMFLQKQYVSWMTNYSLSDSEREWVKRREEEVRLEATAWFEEHNGSE